MRISDPVLLDLPSCIDTPRLMLRVPRAGDGVRLHEAVRDSLPELRRFLASIPWVAGEQSPEASETYCRNAAANFVARRDLPFLIFERAGGALVGATGLHRPDWATPKIEVGYWVRTSHAGRGYIAEAVQALTRYAFEHLGAVRVELVTDEANTASRRVAERCGFTLEGVLHNERRAPDGSLRHTCVYACLGTAPVR
ncbi:MAG: GNAT family N-acetyltransferase [Nitrospira sp.]|nr:GNAT family N-acetyltransferase [Nitrospira sp.]